MTRFSEGQRVRALVSAQGLEAGAVYTIESVRVQSTPFGGFTYYSLAGVGEVGNGHLILEEVAA